MAYGGSELSEVYKESDDANVHLGEGEGEGVGREGGEGRGKSAH